MFTKTRQALKDAKNAAIASLQSQPKVQLDIVDQLQSSTQLAIQLRKELGKVVDLKEDVRKAEEALQDSRDTIAMLCDQLSAQGVETKVTVD